jgi:hypothetical protein
MRKIRLVSNVKGKKGAKGRKKCVGEKGSVDKNQRKYLVP